MVIMVEWKVTGTLKEVVQILMTQIYHWDRRKLVPTSLIMASPCLPKLHLNINLYLTLMWILLAAIFCSIHDNLSDTEAEDKNDSPSLSHPLFSEHKESCVFFQTPLPITLSPKFQHILNELPQPENGIFAPSHDNRMGREHPLGRGWEFHLLFCGGHVIGCCGIQWILMARCCRSSLWYTCRLYLLHQGGAHSHGVESKFKYVV